MFNSVMRLGVAMLGRCRIQKKQQQKLSKLVMGLSLIGLVGCEGILGGIQDPGSGSGCTLIVNILPVCDGGGGAAANSNQIKPEQLTKEASGPSIAWLDAIVRHLVDRV